MYWKNVLTWKSNFRFSFFFSRLFEIEMRKCRFKHAFNNSARHNVHPPMYRPKMLYMNFHRDDSAINNNKIVNMSTSNSRRGKTQRRLYSIPKYGWNWVESLSVGTSALKMNDVIDGVVALSPIVHILCQKFPVFCVFVVRCAAVCVCMWCLMRYILALFHPIVVNSSVFSIEQRPHGHEPRIVFFANENKFSNFSCQSSRSFLFFFWLLLCILNVSTQASRMGFTKWNAISSETQINLA